MPAGGQKISIRNGKLVVPDHPIIPFIEGDGTGRDIWRASVRVLDAAVQKAYGGERKIDWMEVYAGEKAFNAFKNWLPDETVDACREYLVSIKGPLTTPVGGGIRSLNVALRQLLDLYVCLRPVRWFKGVPSPVKAPEKVDMVIFRENTEDSIPGSNSSRAPRTTAEVPRAAQEPISRSTTPRSASPTPAASAIKTVSNEGTERLFRAAVEYALANKRKSVTIVHKGNILKFTEGAFRAWGYALAEREFADQVYTWQQWERTKAADGEKAANDEQGRRQERQDHHQGRDRGHHAAAGPDARRRIRRGRDHEPQRRLSVRRARRRRSAASASRRARNINYMTGHAVFEATHGTAPKYADLDQVNPGSRDPLGRDDAALHGLDRGGRRDHRARWTRPSARRP